MQEKDLATVSKGALQDYFFSLSLSAVTREMKLLPSAGSDRAWVWTVQADFADEEAKPEQLAIRFKNAESKRHFMHPLTTDFAWPHPYNAAKYTAL